MLLRGLFDALVGTAEMDLNAETDGALFPEEEAAVAHAAAKRRREYIAGRICARRAMAALGDRPAPVLQGPDRAPVWPQGLVGSITHADTRCAVAVARVADGFRSLGLDIEPATTIKPELLRVICLPEELAYLDSQTIEDRYLLGKAIFSAKECAYKCQYAMSRCFLDFHAMRIHLDMKRGAFIALFQRDVAPFASGEELRGRLVIDRGYIVTAMALRAGVAGKQ